jgi:hypothetical protein
MWSICTKPWPKPGHCTGDCTGHCTGKRVAARRGVGPAPGLLLFLAVASAIAAPAHAESDFGVSYNLLLKADINDDWFVMSRSNIATRDDNSETFLGYTGVSIGRQLSDAWSLRVGYRYAKLKIGDRWRSEDRPFVESYGATMRGGWRLTNRSRIEFRHYEDGDDDIRLRTEFGARSPWSLTPLGLRPFVEDEIFYGLDADRVEANWLTLGVSWPVASGSAKVGYRWNRFRVGDDWRDRDVLVLGLNLFF